MKEEHRSPSPKKQAQGPYGITQMTQMELENRWFRQLKRVKQMLPQLKEGLKTTAAYRDALYQIAEMQAGEYMGKLQNKDAWNSLSFCLRRYLCERFSEQTRNEPPASWSAQMGDRIYDFSPVRPGEPIPEGEAEDYADLLYQITLENRCFYVSKAGVVDCRRGAVSKQEYRNYLAHKGISRRGLFVLSMALKFDVDTMSEFMNALGESPVYNFRDAEECIYYFCHRSQAFQSMEAVRRLRRDYEENRTTGKPDFELPDLTRTISQGIDRIIQQDYPDEEALRQAFLNYLVALRPQFTGFSRTARKLFRKELLTTQVEGFSYDDVVRLEHQELGNSLLTWSAVVVDEEKQTERVVHYGRNSIGDQLYSIAINGTKESKDGEVSLRWLDLDKRITQDLLDGPRLRQLLPTLEEEDTGNSGKTVTKKDLLLVRFLKLVDTVKFADLDEEEHRELIEEFHASTDQVLIQAGLPVIYLGNPFENMIFVALCSHTPQKFIPQIFESAPRKPGAKPGYK